jgi:DNA-directed RNA polymerase subunit L
MADFKQSRAVIEHRPAKVGEEIIYQGTVYRVVDRGKSYVTALDKRIGTFTIDDGQYAVISHENNLTVKLDVDASDAITALKAIQREARKATQALRELESEAAELSGSEIAQLFGKGEVITREQLRKLIEWLTEMYRELGGEQAELHKDEVVIPKELVEKIASTNITINIPEITVKDDADIEKIARELAEKIRQAREVSKRE